MHTEYLPKTLEGMRDHIFEEMGEVLTADAKIKRFGLDSCNPNVPEAERITNEQAFLEELKDLESAIGRYLLYYYNQKPEND